MTWTFLDDIAWEDGFLTLALANEEKNGSLILVYEDGEVLRVKMGEILKAKPAARNKMRTDKHPVFICPAKEDDALLVIYRDTKGQSVMRLDDIAGFKTAKMTDQGDPYSDNNMVEIITCEIIPSEHHEPFKPMHNMLRNSSYLTNHYYGEAIRKTLNGLGVALP